MRSGSVLSFIVDHLNTRPLTQNLFGMQALNKLLAGDTAWVSTQHHVFVRAWSDKHITTYIIELLIDPYWRGRGIGSTLLDVCHALYPLTRMEVASTEQSAIFYQRHGFRAIGRMHRKSFV